jgi:16S rRNA A1518/A1519 N6-dimethyltransferase RsmA/KsgA/DIM1 with predicted DNA glycosylase/AP lyase activity
LQTYKHILKCCKDIQVEKILDVGAGEGSLLEQMSIHNFAKDLYGVEISESGCQTIREKNIPNLIDILKFDGYKRVFEKSLMVYQIFSDPPKSPLKRGTLTLVPPLLRGVRGDL